MLRLTLATQLDNAAQVTAIRRNDFQFQKFR
jgi:hypothetical protein